MESKFGISVGESSRMMRGDDLKKEAETGSNKMQSPPPKYIANEFHRVFKHQDDDLEVKPTIKKIVLLDLLMDSTLTKTMVF